MTGSSEISRIDRLFDEFEHVRLSPEGWPVVVTGAIASARTFARWPDFPVAATVDRSRLGHGTAPDATTARRGAVGELIEIASCCEWPDESWPRMTLAEGREAGAWPPGLLNGFADRQIAGRDAWNARMAGMDWIPPALPATGLIDWVQAEDPRSGRQIPVPADFALIGRRERGDREAASVADTNGCGAGPTPAAARTSALCELIERDATGRWWYGRRKAPAATPEGGLAETVADALSRRGRRLWLLDITSDIPVPAVAALATDADGRHVALGVAARPDKRAAMDSALSELMMMELRIAAALSGLDDSPEIATWFDEVDFGRDPPFHDGPTIGRATPAGDAVSDETLLEAIAAAGCRVAFIDRTRPEFGIPAVRAVSPDLCHWKPRLGRARLLEGLPREALNDRLLRI